MFVTTSCMMPVPFELSKSAGSLVRNVCGWVTECRHEPLHRYGVKGVGSLRLRRVDGVAQTRDVPGGPVCPRVTTSLAMSSPISELTELPPPQCQHFCSRSFFIPSSLTSFTFLLNNKMVPSSYMLSRMLLLVGVCEPGIWKQLPSHYKHEVLLWCPDQVVVGL